MSSLLLIEDDVILGETLADCFSLNNFNLTWARSLKEAHRALSEQKFDLALIDITLPDGSGLDFAELLSMQYSLPFVFLTARNEAESRLSGYELGARDYIPKPFHFKELLIRVQKILTPIESPKILTINGRKINIDSQSISDSEDMKIPLSYKDFLVLQLLIENSPKIVTRDLLLNKIWGEERYPTPRTVDNSIMRIRKALSDKNGQYIQSIRGAGYQMNLPFANS